MMNPWGYGYNYGYSGWGEALSILFAILIIVLIVSIIRRMIWGCKTHRHGRFCGMCGDGLSGSKEPLDILKERYAKGEIKKEEFEQMKKNLGI